MTFSKLHKVAVGIGTLSGIVSYYYFNNDNKVYNSWTTNYEPSKFAKWDYNWDHRAPGSITKPMKMSTEAKQNQVNEELEGAKTSAVRHIFLIRHGQYNLDGLTDQQRTLTQLGRSQADITGKRLKELSLPYTEMVKSTMSRAQETGSIISESLPDVPVKHCDLLREGCPVPPEPPIGGYKPETFQFYQDGSRIEAAFRKYFYRADPSQLKDSYTILVCHANVIRYFVCRSLQFPAEAWLRLSLNHGSITWISITPSGRVVLRNLGESGHMPVEMLTSR